ncbi:MAG: UTRA domain-containing protein [Maricaulaceae bacterium]
MKKITTWQAIEAEVMRRISSKMWQAGELIPGEIGLAEEFGCARATVNRALRQLADAGILERRRKGGTRVARYPVRKATLDIPITRLEIEGRGKAYEHSFIGRKFKRPPQSIQEKMNLSSTQKALHIPAVHYADKVPFLYESRWVNLEAVPQIKDESFVGINANEWLIEHAAYSRGDIHFSAANAKAKDAELLKCNIGDALFIIDRTTWHREQSITSVRLAYAPGFHMKSQI